MQHITLCRMNREFAEPHQYLANSKRITKARFELLETLAERSDCFITKRKGDVWKHYKTVRIPDGI